MAHKTLVNGTAYDITGGKTLVSGTSYSVQGGKVLVNGTAYDISFLLPPAALDLWSNADSSNEITCIAYGDGYWVVGGRYCDGSNTYSRIAYTTSLDGSWTIRDLWYVTNNVGRGIRCITYANGYWVVGGQYWSTNNSNAIASIAYATSPDGTWTQKDLWSGSSSECINDIAYGDGCWGVVGYYYNGTYVMARVAKSETLDGTWTFVTAPWYSNTAVHGYCLTYTNGYWVVGGNSYFNMKYSASIAYTTSLGSSWTTKTLWDGSSNTSSAGIYGIEYANGYWVVAGVFRQSVQIAYSTSISGSWTINTLWSSTSTGTCTSLCYANGYWAISGKSPNTLSASIAYATTPDGTWTIKDLWTNQSTSYYIVANAIVNAGGYWMAGGQFYNNSVYNAHLEYSPTLDGFDEI